MVASRFFMTGALLCALSVSARGQELRLFSKENVAAATELTLPVREPEVRGRAARFDLQLLDRVAAAGAMEARRAPVLLDLFEDLPLEIEVRRVVPYGKGRYVIDGAVLEEGKQTGGFALLSVVDGALQAEVTLPDGRKFSINHTGGESCRISELAPEATAIHCAVGAEGTPEALANSAQPAGAAPIAKIPDAAEEALLAATAADPPVIDLMIVYTSAIQAKFSSSGGIQAHCQLAAEAANVTFANSGIHARVRLVAARWVNYTESGDVGKDLLRLGDPFDGHLDEVPALREQYAADVVHLFGSVPQSGAGMATGYPSEYHSVLMGGNTNTFVHELGHNFGCQHDRAAAGAGGVSYAFGHIFPANNGQSYGCIMSYTGNAGAIQLSQFSNPNLSHQGAPTGVPKGLPGAADNTRMVNITAPLLAAFREPDGSSSRMPIYATPPVADFPRTEVGATSAQQTIRLTYASASQWRPVQITGFRVNDPAGAFTVQIWDAQAQRFISGDSFAITPPGFVQLLVRFRPTSPERAEATVTFSVDESSYHYSPPPIRLVGNANAPRLRNISTRGPVGAGDDVLIGGFIIGGTAPRDVLVRAIGPSLADRRVSGALADTTLELYRGSELIAQNDDWWDGFPRESIRWSGLPPTRDLESAVRMKLEPGSYTAVVRGYGGTSGIGMIEAYDLDADEQTQFLNISTRGEVGAGDGVLIGGFILGGAAPTRVLVRAIGPSLENAGVSGVLADPVLDIHNAQGARISSNDNWRSDDEAAINGTGIPPGDDREAATLLTLPPGAYTAIVRGANATHGIGLVELYRLAAE